MSIYIVINRPDGSQKPFAITRYAGDTAQSRADDIMEQIHGYLETPGGIKSVAYVSLHNIGMQLSILLAGRLQALGVKRVIDDINLDIPQIAVLPEMYDREKASDMLRTIATRLARVELKPSNSNNSTQMALDREAATRLLNYLAATLHNAR